MRQSILLLICVSAMLNGACTGSGRGARDSVEMSISGADPDDAFLRRLDGIFVNVKFDNEKAESVFDGLAMLYGLNICVRWQALENVGVDRDKRVSCTLRHVSMKRALQLLLDQMGDSEPLLAFEMVDEVIEISTKEDLDRHTVVRVYDLSGLIGEGMTKETILDVEYAGFDAYPKPSTKPAVVVTNYAMDDLKEIIEQVVEPESWRECGGDHGTIRGLGHHFIVKQTRAAHRQIADLLYKLREAKAAWKQPFYAR